MKNELKFDKEEVTGLYRIMKNELKFDKEEAIGLYRIFCGLSKSWYQNAEVYDDAKFNMEKVYCKVIEWGIKNCDDMRGEKYILENEYDSSRFGDI